MKVDNEQKKAFIEAIKLIETFFDSDLSDNFPSYTEDISDCQLVTTIKDRTINKACPVYHLRCHYNGPELEEENGKKINAVIELDHIWFADKRYGLIWNIVDLSDYQTT